MKKKQIVRLALLCALLIPYFSAAGQQRTIIEIKNENDSNKYALRLRTISILGREGVDDSTIFASSSTSKSRKFIMDSMPEFFKVRIVDLKNRNRFKDFLLFQAGDSIVINQTKDGIHYSGTGTEKLQCSRELENLEQTALKKGVRTDLAYMSYPYLRYVYITYEDSLQKEAAKILQKYKDVVPESARKMLWAEFYGKRQFDKLTSIIFRIGPNSYPLPTSQMENLIRFIRTDISNEAVDTSQGELLACSQNYTDCILQREVLLDNANRYPISAGQKTLESVEYRTSLFHHIAEKYTGVLKDRLLTSCLIMSMTRHTNGENDSLTYDFKWALKDISDKKLVNILMDLNNHHRPGTPAYPFSLEDSTGRVYRLEDFKGKVIVLDFWFRGCGACLGLAIQMKPVYDQLATNPNVAFVSIAVDSKREDWLRGLRSGEYTHPGQINLYTAKDKLITGNVSQIEAFYGIIAFPQLFLINPYGNIITTTVKRPINVEKLVTLIESHTRN